MTTPIFTVPWALAATAVTAASARLLNKASILCIGVLPGAYWTLEVPLLRTVVRRTEEIKLGRQNGLVDLLRASVSSRGHTIAVQAASPAHLIGMSASAMLAGN